MNEETTKVTLTKELQTIIDSLGDTPLDEPELFKALDEKPLKKSKAIKIALARHDLKLKDFKNALDLANFFHALTEKIVSFRDDEGAFKSTENTAEMDLPDFEEAETIQEFWIDLMEETNTKKQAKMNEEFEEIAWEISGLKKAKLTDWEQSLVVQQILQSAYDVTLTSLGKPSKAL